MGSIILEDIHKLPLELAAYKGAQKENDTYIAFHGELSPYSNFHHSKFTVNNHMYHSSEQWIKFQKAMLFGDSMTVNQTLASSTPYKAKQLSYNINGFDTQWWRTDSYDICLGGITEKFLQNPPKILQMLKATKPKMLVEATLDKQWGTGVQLRDPNALTPEKWYSK